jgi:hypothetical protein
MKIFFSIFAHEILLYRTYTAHIDFTAYLPHIYRIFTAHIDFIFAHEILFTAHFIFAHEISVPIHGLLPLRKK